MFYYTIKDDNGNILCRGIYAQDESDAKEQFLNIDPSYRGKKIFAIFEAK